MTTQSVTPAKKGEQVPLGERVSFGFAEFGSQLIWTTVGSYLISFYTSAALIPAVVAGNILLLARILDGVQDLGVGYIAERTHSRWGRFRPYVIFGAPVVSISMILAFWVPFSGGSAKVVWAAITYVLLCFSYTVANMSYGSLAGVMTTDSGERLTLNWIRGIGTQAGQLLLAVLTPLLLAAFVATESAKEKGGDTRSYFITMAIYAAIALPMFLITGLNVRERITMTVEQQKISFVDTVKAVVTNTQLLVVFFYSLFLLIGIFGRVGVMYVFCIHVLGEPLAMTVVMLSQTIGQTIGCILLPPLALKYGKRRMIMISSLSVAVMFIIIFAVASSVTLPVMVALQFVCGLAMFASPIGLSMVPDAVDWYENKTGVRADGTSYAAVSLATKIASAVGGAISLYIIGFFGYDGAAQQQTAETIRGINIAANLMPAIMLVLSFVVILFWKLDTKTMEKVAAELEAKHEAALAAEAAKKN